MISSFFSVTLLGIITIVIYLGLGQRVLDRMRLTDTRALTILAIMILGHFLPTFLLTSRVAINLGAIIPIGVVIYLLVTTSKLEQQKAGLASLATGLLVLLTDKLLPLEPGFLDPVFSAGIFAGLSSYILGRSRRGAFIAGILGIFFVDLANFIQLWFQGIPQQTTIGSGGLFSSLVISPFLAVLIAEVIGEIREKIELGGDHYE